MRSDLDDALVRDFPRLFRDRHGDARETSMCWGFPGDGWEPLIRRLSEKLEPLAREFGLRASQVKEKFGALRFYVRGADGARKLPATISEAVHAAIMAAMEESGRTCEHCGAAGSTTMVGGWCLTLCAARGARPIVFERRRVNLLRPPPDRQPPERVLLDGEVVDPHVQYRVEVISRRVLDDAPLAGRRLRRGERAAAHVPRWS